jgi:iron complex outermembrane receptor protein
VHSLRAQAQWNHTSGYHSIVTPVQNDVGAFDVVNLFLSYDMSNGGLRQGLQLTLNVNNMLDRNPPTLKADLGYANGSTVGRLVRLGIDKRF